MVRYALVFMISTFAMADAWGTFHAEKVISMECTVKSTSVDFGERDKNGKPIYEDKFEAAAHAKRDGMEDWEQSLGYFPPTDKGADKAIDTCKAWRKMANKKWRIAHGGTK